MKFLIKIHSTALLLAIEKRNIEIIKSLLSHKKINVNIVNKITIYIYLISFLIKYFNDIKIIYMF